MSSGRRHTRNPAKTDRGVRVSRSPLNCRPKTRSPERLSVGDGKRMELKHQQERQSKEIQSNGRTITVQEDTGDRSRASERLLNKKLNYDRQLKYVIAYLAAEFRH